MPEQGDIRAKICGLKDPDHVAVAVESGAAYLGFVFFPPSPRHLNIADAKSLCQAVPAGHIKVALTVDATDEMLDALDCDVPLDMLQLHGTESPERVSYIRARYGLPVMKAVGVADKADLDQIARYAGVADQLLIDAKPPRNSELPGGNGLAFDWRLLQGRRWPVPWMLAGGLTPDNVAEAIELTGANQVDVSTGVERERGVKDPELIKAFLAAAHSAKTVPSLLD